MMSERYTTDELQTQTERGDELAAQVEGLIMERDALAADNAALRAQLDAAKFTYDTDPPVDAQIDAICHEVQMDARGTWWHGSNIIYPDGWRPAPPQE